MTITRKELIKKYIEFFKKNKHKEIPNASLIPKDDPTVLFTTAGMHPLVPYLLGQKHPLGKRLVNIQGCVRTTDIEEVGDATHHTFFEMFGYWSLGDYWKEEAIKMTLEFHTKVLKIPLSHYAVSCFKGDNDAQKDTESSEIWESLGIPKERIAFLGKEDNWWGPAGNTGPCGPDTEQFFWTSKSKPPKKFDPNDNRWVEIGNDVLMQYIKNEKGQFEEAKQKNIDFGGGVERTLAVLNGLDDNYLTEVWQPIIKEIEKLSGKTYKGNEKEMRIVADHIKASVMIIADGITPSNTGQGYVLRRLIRRAVRYGRELNLKNFTHKIAEPALKIYKDYPELTKKKTEILNTLKDEEEKFLKTLEKGLRISDKIFTDKEPIKKEKFNRLMADKNKSILIGRIFDLKEKKKDYSLKSPKISKEEIDKATIDGKEGFLLYQSYGFPIEMVDELAMAKGFLVDHHGFRKEQQSHVKASGATTGTFKSGLADNSEQTTKLHTASHLLNEALRQILDKGVAQKGSNITPERLRFDFNFPRKLTDEEKKKVEDLINKKIQENLEVTKEEMPLKKALASGAHGEFGARYPNTVSVYTIGPEKKPFSKEICTGPHVNNTKELGKFKIIKEESSSAGVRRIKATVEN